jgi:molecular chaperone DnaK
LSKDEAEKMRAEAESHAEEDRKKVAEVEARNGLDSRVYQMEKLIRENREKVPEADVKAVEEAIEKAKSALAGGSLEAMQSATQELEKVSHKVAEVLYQATAAAGAGGPASGGPAPGSEGQPGGKKPGEGEVIDAEYVDVDESKKPN